MSLVDAYPKLQERFELLKHLHPSGLAFAQLGPPDNIHNDPFLYYWFVGDTAMAQTRTEDRRYIIGVVVGVKQTDTTKAEMEIAHFVDLMPTLFYATTKDDDGHPYPTLGGTVNMSRLGPARRQLLTERILFRHLQYELEITDKRVT